MRSTPLYKGLLLLSLILLSAPALAQDLELPSFAEAPEEIRGDLRDALFEEVEILGERVLSPRTSEDVRRRLETLAAKQAREGSVQRYLGRSLDALGQHKAAESAFNRAEALTPGASWPFEELASFHNSRGNRMGELSALKNLAARQQAAIDVPGTRSELAKTWVRIAETIEAHQIDEDPLSYRRQAAELQPNRYGASENVIRWLIDRGRLQEAVEQFAWARRIWPEEHEDLAIQEMDLLFRLQRHDEVRELLRREIALDEGDGNTWVWGSYVERLRQRGELEAEVRRVRSLLRGGPLAGVDLAEAAHLLRSAGHEDEAARAVRRSLDSADRSSDEDLLILAALLRHLDQDREATRVLYALAATNRGEVGDVAQARLALLLGERRGDVRPSGLRALLDPAHLDPGPSVTGGLLSLLWGGPPGPEVRRELERRDQRHLQAAWSSALIEDLSRRRPGWEKLASAELRLIDAYRSHGARRAALQASRRFLEQHPDHPEYFRIGLAAGELMEELGQSSLAHLRRLARVAADRGDHRRHRDILRVIEDLLSRQRRFEEMVTIYWSAIDARPDDVGLYQDLLAFLDRHNLYDEQQRVYQRTLERFQGDDWPSRYARWMVRRRSVQASQELIRRLVGELSPDDVAGFLQRSADAGARGSETERFFLEIYRDALRRYPTDLALARRLFAYYDGHRAAYQAERLALLVCYAPYDPVLRAELYSTLARTGQLSGALETLAGDASVAGRLLAADFLIRRAEQRAARPIVESLSRDLPHHREFALRLSGIEASLGNGDRAREVITGLLSHWPADADLLTRAGELALAQDDLTGARHLWGRIHQARPGDPAAYRQVATIFWDFYLFDDALRVLVASRVALGDEDLFAFELASVHESAGHLEPAIREYIRVLADAAREYDVWPPYDMRPRPSRSVRPAVDLDDLDELDRSEESDDLLVHVRGRLVQLASREGSRELVEEVTRDLLAQTPEDNGLIHLRIDLLEATGRWDEAYRLLADSALALNNASLQERAVRELTAAGHEQEATAVLRRLAQNRPMDLTPTYRLADDLERRGHIRAAAVALRELADRLGGDENRGQDQTAVTARMARMLYAHQRHDDAIAAAQRAITMAQGSRQQALKVELARWLVRLERADEAVALLGPVLAEDPSSADALDVQAAALVAVGRAGGQPRQEVVAGLIRTFDGAIEATRVSGDDSEVTSGQVRDLRLTLTRYLLQLGAHRAVRDQHIALLNADLENRELLMRAYRHAAANDLLEGLERSYVRDAERSPRDHRLPLVLARLAAARGDTTVAVTQMERVLAVAPERLDLREEMIGYLVRQLDWTQADGGWREAARQYRLLSELQRQRGGQVARWIAEEARMQGRVGDWRAMDEAVERLISDAEGDPTRLLEAAQLYVHSARWERAWEQARAYLDFWREADDDRLQRLAQFSSPRLDQVAELAVRSGNWREAVTLFGDLERRLGDLSESPEVVDRYLVQRLRRQAAEARGQQMADALREYGVDRDIRGYTETLERELAGTPLDALNDSDLGELMRTADLAAAAGAPRRQLELLEALRGRLEGTHRGQVANHISLVLEGMEAMRELQGLVDDPDLTPEHRSSLGLRVATSLGDRQAEEQVLAQRLEAAPEPSFDRSDSQFERLLTLRWQGGAEARASIPQLAASDSGRSGQVINFLIERGGFDSARTALERFAGDNESLWLDTARARLMLLRSERVGEEPDEWEPFARALDLRPIGLQVARPTNRRRSLTGEAWTQLAQPYGEALARTGGDRPTGTRMLEHAGIELSPRSAQAHVRVANEALARSDPGLALTHFRLARQLAPRSLAITDGQARALSALGRNNEALALWDEVLDACTGEGCVAAVIRSMTRAGRADQAMTRAAAYLRANWRSGTLSLALVQQLAGVVGERGLDRDGPLDRLVWELWEMDRSRSDLLAVAAGIGDEQLLAGRARGRYLREGLRRLSRDSYEREGWIEAYVVYLAEVEEHQALVELIDRYFADRASGRWWTPPAGLRLARARALLALGRRDRAMQDLGAIARGTETSRAVGLLRELDHEREAWELQLTVARERLAEGREDRAEYLAAVEALLELGRGDEAAALVRRAAAQRADDPTTFRALAELLADHDRQADALWLRRVLYRMDRSDHANLLAMARLEMELGQHEVARRRALALLARWAVPSEVEEGANQLLVDLVASSRRQGGTVITSLGDALADRSLDEDRALALARVLYHVRHRRQAKMVLERSAREAVAPWRSLQLLASWEDRAERYREASIYLEAALIHSNGATSVRQQLFLVRRRMDQHQAALAAIGILSDRPVGLGPLEGLDTPEAIALCAEISDSASQLNWWSVADSYAAEGVGRIDADEDPERARHERARVQTIREQLAYRRAAAQGRPWIRRGR